jgi:Na+/H+ antiporter NhaD/arsenite permease-like protein
MVMARALARTGVFDWVGSRFHHATGGSGRRFLLLLIALVAPLCAFLPNATAVILLALIMRAGIGMLSALLANIPVVAAALIMTKGHLVAAEAVPELALAASFTEWPTATIPVFVAMMFGATLGGNATLIGASANMVAVGICAKEGERVSFMRFMRYGLPITLVQLGLGALYVLALTALLP